MFVRVFVRMRMRVRARVLVRVWGLGSILIPTPKGGECC